MTDQVEYIDIRGARIQVLSGGEGSPLVYLHSGGGETFWLPFHEALAQHFRVYAPAHPGFDQSEGLDRIRDIEDLAFHYLDLLDAMKLDKVDIVGLSLGGWIAAEFAVRWQERVNRLVLADSAGIWIEESPMAELFGLEPSEMRELAFYDPKSETAMAMMQDDPPEEMMVMMFKAMESLARVGWNPYLHNPKLHDRLGRIRVPTMLLWGEDDKIIPPAYAHAFNKAIPNSEIAFIKQCGHLPIVERPEAFVEHVVRFLKA
jgi:pimeloyl-ACP methyl ester carboxylesterase